MNWVEITANEYLVIKSCHLWELGATFTDTTGEALYGFGVPAIDTQWIALDDVNVKIKYSSRQYNGEWIDKLYKWA